MGVSSVCIPDYNLIHHFLKCQINNNVVNSNFTQRYQKAHLQGRPMERNKLIIVWAWVEILLIQGVV